jgi:MFS family permease
MSTKMILLLLALFLDLFSVALVVPLLPIIYKELGGSTEMWGLMASVYSISQIVGSIAMGKFADHYGRKNALLVSMLGSAISYAIVGVAHNVAFLVISRVLVGVVKQTVTLSTALAAEWVGKDERAAAVARISAGVSLGWMSGQYIGGLASESFGERLPIALAVVLFLIDALWVQFAIGAEDTGAGGGVGESKSNPASPNDAMDERNHEEDSDVSMASTLLMLSDGPVAVVVSLRCAYVLIWRSAEAMKSFYLLERFGLGVGDLGRIGAYQVRHRSLSLSPPPLPPSFKFITHSVTPRPLTFPYLSSISISISPPPPSLPPSLPLLPSHP